MRVFLAGEGRTELGEWAKEPPYRERPGEKGVLVALIERVASHAVTIVDGLAWSKIRKYKAGNHASPEERNVLGLALGALRARCDVVVFSRDRDGSPDRHGDVEAGVRRARELFAGLKMVAGVAIENIEGWVLVLLGFHTGERVSSKKTKSELETRFGITTVQQMVDAVARAALDKLPPGSLSAWLEVALSSFAHDESDVGV